MNWAEIEARKLIENNPEKEKYVIASGVSPSGFIHIGNFREIVTPYFIGKELERLGKEVRYILSFDDFDRFRKVPKKINSEYEKYIGKPYSSIPSPYNKNKTYAQEMEDIFLEELKRMNIIPEVIYQTNEYKSGRYDHDIELSLRKRKIIFDILSRYKTQTFTKEDRDNYYPISLYCNSCGKDSTTIINYDDDTGNISYICECGYQQTQHCNEYKNIKLQWKIDWPMRWKQEKVDLESGGRDHSEENGSFAVAKDIVKEIFEYHAPWYVPYDFIGIKGANGKMASSTGNVLTLTNLLEVYDKNIILWFYAKNKPSHQFNIALDDDVLRYYSEYDRFVKSYFNGTLDDKNSSILKLTDVQEDYLKFPDFSMIANFLPMVNYDANILNVLLHQEKEDIDDIHFKSRLLRATYWLQKYGNSKICLLSEFNDGYYSTLSDLEKSWLNETIAIIENGYDDLKDLQSKLYAVVKKYTIDEQELKQLQKRYFQVIYNMLLGQNRGPKLYLLLSTIDIDRLKLYLICPQSPDMNDYAYIKNN